MLAIVTGATGFLGRRVVGELCTRGIEVRCLVQRPGREKTLEGLRADIHYGSVADPAALRAAFYDADVVVHLVAIIREGRGATFESINLRGTENVLEAARGAGTKHFIHMSALGARDDLAYPYLRSKWRAERAVEASGLPYTIFRPSLLFGEGDEFLNTLAGLVRAFPLVVPILGSGRTPYQPIAAEDVARCVAQAAGREDLMGSVIELGGPDYLTYDDIVNIVARTFGVRRKKLHIPLPVMRLFVRAMEVVLPRPPATTQQLTMVTIPNTAELGTVDEVFGFKPRPLKGNIDFVKGITPWEGLRMVLGFMPSRIRDH